MMRPMLAATVLLLALPAVAQDFGGMMLRSPAAVLDRVEQASASGCRLLTTSVTVRVTRATAAGTRR